MGEALAATEHAIYVHEPDNHGHRSLAMFAKAGLGAFPALLPEQRAPRLERLWNAAFNGAQRGRVDRIAEAISGGRSLERRLDVVAERGVPPIGRKQKRRIGSGSGTRPTPIVKSVQAMFCTEWLLARYDVQLVVVRRDPRNVLASWLDMAWGDLGAFCQATTRAAESRAAMSTPTDDFARRAWAVAVICEEVERLAALPGAVVVTHEDACRAPQTYLRTRAVEAGLCWGPAADAYVAQSEAPGEGYDTHRVAAEQIERWRRTLTSDQLANAEALFARFGLVSDTSFAARPMTRAA